MNDVIRLACDLDGVLTEHPRILAHAANDTYGLSLPPHAFVDSASCNVPAEIRRWVYGPDGPARRLAPVPDGAAFIAAAMAALGAENVFILTARPEESRATTEEWLRAHGFPPCRLVFAEDKVPVALARGVTHAVEDSLRHATAYAAAGIRCLLLTSDPAPPGESPLIERVPDLEAVRARLLGEPDDREPAEERRTIRYRIVISDVIDPQARARLAREAELIDVDGQDVAALTAALRDADALIVRSETQVTREVLAAGPALRVVARAGTGVDNIDVPSATAAGILVLNAPGANAVSAGEHTIALLLALTRQIPAANAAVHGGRWERKRFQPFDLQGKTVGIVGLGRVGSVVAQRLRAFETRLLGYDPYIARERFQQLGVEPVPYERLLAESDVVTFHVPATPETIGMLDAAAIARLKPGALVINCARGEVVDQAALAAALRAGRVGGAAVDVFPEEPAHTSPLFGLPNVILTPHIGGSSREALAAVGEMISTTTLAALRGEAVPNAVNLPPASLQGPELQRLTHVASAAGRLLAVLRSRRPERLEVIVQGAVPPDVAERATAAALAEALRRWTDRRVTPVNARLIAQEVGLDVSIVVGDADPARVPEFAFEVDGDDPHRVTVRWDRHEAGILEVDRFSLERPLAGDLLITRHRDRPGIVGRIGTILGRYEVNIAGMQVGRHERGGQAIMVLNVDDAIPEAALAEIVAIPGIESAYVVSLPPAEPESRRMSPVVAQAAR
ncbi:MAG: phosphoglycerate dehydrogenase [Sphaerobacter sp.]|nr:phosphoglycerate dehydrogenase [Sphaerobacter sp.]